jgi:hypothetical protein
MKTLYTLQTIIWNGTHVMQNHVDAFLDRELAERTQKALNEANKYGPFPATTKLEEVILFETEDDVPILR